MSQWEIEIDTPEYDLPVLTNDGTDFSDIDGLHVIALADVLSA